MVLQLKQELQQKLKSKKRAFNRWLKIKRFSEIAELIPLLNETELKKLIKITKEEYLARIILKTAEDVQIQMIKNMSSEKAAQIFSWMLNDEVTDIMNNFSRDRRKEILSSMTEEKATNIRKLLKYSTDSAGGLMTTEFLVYQKSLTVGEILNNLENKLEGKTASLETIFVIDEYNNLVGKVNLEDILASSKDEGLENIINYNIITVTAEVDQEQVSQLFSKNNLKVIPVVNSEQQIIGIITVDDIIDVIEEEATEDMLKMVGVSTDERANSSLLSSLKKRLPWLFVNLVTAFMAAFVVGMFEDVIAQVVALAVAMPIVAGMGGNSGSQTLSIMIREIALEEINFRENWKIFFKEIILGLIHGAAIGILTGVILYLNYGNFYLGAIIFLAMIANLVIAGVSGFLIPLTLRALGVDPALAAAIFLTTATDVFGFFVFLGLAKILIDFL